MLAATSVQIAQVRNEISEKSAERAAFLEKNSGQISTTSREFIAVLDRIIQKLQLKLDELIEKALAESDGESKGNRVLSGIAALVPWYNDGSEKDPASRALRVDPSDKAGYEHVSKNLAAMSSADLVATINDTRIERDRLDAEPELTDRHDREHLECGWELARETAFYRDVALLDEADREFDRLLMVRQLNGRVMAVDLEDRHQVTEALSSWHNMPTAQLKDTILKTREARNFLALNSRPNSRHHYICLQTAATMAALVADERKIGLPPDSKIPWRTAPQEPTVRRASRDQNER